MPVLERLRAYVTGVGAGSDWTETLYSDEEQDVEAVRKDIAALGDYPVEDRRAESRIGQLLPGGDLVEMHTEHLDIVCRPGTARINGRGSEELNEQEEDLKQYLEETYDAKHDRRER